MSTSRSDHEFSHIVRTAEQQSLVTVLREFFAAEPALREAYTEPVFPDLRHAAPNFKIWGSWNDETSLVSKLISILQDKGAKAASSASGREYTLSREQTWAHLNAVCTAMGRESNKKFDAFVPGSVRWDGKVAPVPTSLPSSATGNNASSGRRSSTGSAAGSEAESSAVAEVEVEDVHPDDAQDTPKDMEKSMVGSSANNRRTAAARKAANLEEEARMLSSFSGRGPNDADEDDDEDDDDEDECSPEEMAIQLAEYTCLREALEDCFSQRGYEPVFPALPTSAPPVTGGMMRLSDRHVKYGGYVKATHFISIAAEGDEKPLGALILEEVRKRLGGCGGAEASASAVFNLLSSFGRLHGQEEPAAFGSFDPNSYATYSRRDVQEAAAEASRQARRKRQLEQGPKDIGRRTSQMAKPGETLEHYGKRSLAHAGSSGSSGSAVYTYGGGNSSSYQPSPPSARPPAVASAPNSKEKDSPTMSNQACHTTAFPTVKPSTSARPPPTAQYTYAPTGAGASINDADDGAAAAASNGGGGKRPRSTLQSEQLASRVAEQRAMVEVIQRFYDTEPALSNEEVAFPDLRVYSRNAHIWGGWQDELSLASRLISSVQAEAKAAVEAVTGKPYSLSREATWLHLQAVCNGVGRESHARFRTFEPGSICWNGKYVGKHMLDDEVGGGGGGGIGRVPARPPRGEGDVSQPSDDRDATARTQKAAAERAKVAAQQQLKADAAKEGLHIEYDSLCASGYAGVSYAKRGTSGQPPFRATLEFYHANGKSGRLTLGFFTTPEAAALVVARARALGVDGLGRRAPVPLPRGCRLEPFPRVQQHYEA